MESFTGFGTYIVSFLVVLTVLVFVHAGTERVNVVYRRGDGAIGWIDPPERGTP